MDFSALKNSLGPVQDSMKKEQAARAALVIEGSAGGGAVKVRLTGALMVKGVVIAPAAAAASAGDVTMLEDLVAAAMDDALRQWRARYGATPEEQLQKLFANADLSALMGPMMGMLK